MQGKKLYTLGYSGAKLDAIKAFVERENLVVVDTRLSPRSRAPMWNKGNLAMSLGSHYQHIHEFGNQNYKSGGPISLVDVDTGIHRVDYILERCDGVVLVCVCKDLDTCHRKVVCEALEAHYGVAAVHLSADLHIPPDPDEFLQLKLLL